MQHDGSLENFPFRGPLYIHAKVHREQLLQNNHKHGSRTKYFNKNKDTLKNTGSPQENISCHSTKVISVQFDYPYDHIHHMDHNHEDTHIIDTQYQDMENNEAKQDELYYKTNDYLINEEKVEHIHPDLY